jgi:hypothetical protein
MHHAHTVSEMAEEVLVHRRRPEQLGLGNHSGLRWSASFRQKLVVSCRSCVTVHTTTRGRMSGRRPLPEDGLRSEPI